MPEKDSAFKFTLRMPKWLHCHIAIAAKEGNRSVNEQINLQLVHFLKFVKTDPEDLPSRKPRHKGRKIVVLDTSWEQMKTNLQRQQAIEKREREIFQGARSRGICDLAVEHGMSPEQIQEIIQRYQNVELCRDF